MVYENMNDISLERLDRKEYSKTRLMTLMTELDQIYIPPISSITDIGTYCDKLITYAEVFIMKQKEDDSGFIAVYANDQEQHCAFISSIGIKQAFRGHGMGVLLINRAVEVARKQGMRQIRLEVNRHNDAALRLYHRYGFSKIACFVQDKEKDSVILEKKI